MASWITSEQKAEMRRKAGEALAMCDAALGRAAHHQRTTGSAGIVHKTRDNARVEPEPREVSKRSEPAKPESVQPPVVAANETQVWWEWTQKHVECRLGEFAEDMAEKVAEAMAEWVGSKVDPIKRELELLRREFTVLREEVAVERKLKTLRRQIPSVPAIEERLNAENAHLKAEQMRLKRELDATKNKLGRLRVDQSISDYNLRQLQKQAEASAGASVELEFESRSAHFQMKATHPDAAKALKEFATGIINGQADGTLWLPGQAGTA
jgi:hypothetical protein